MKGRAFFDTNVLIYARLLQNKEKKHIAENLLNKCCRSKTACISTQVVQEFCNIMLKKSSTTDAQLKQMLCDMQAAFNIVPVQMPIVERALDIKTRYGFSFWDSLVVAAALLLDCSVLYTEDLQTNQVVDGILSVVNPFVL